MYSTFTGRAVFSLVSACIFLVLALPVSAQEPALKATYPHTKKGLLLRPFPFVAFSADGNTLASAHGKTVRLWDIQTGRAKAILKEHTLGDIFSVALNADGTLLATGSSPSTLKLWNVKTGKEKATIALKSPVAHPKLAFNKDGTMLASTLGNTIKVWDVETLKEKSILKGHPRNVLSVAFCSDDTLASGSTDSTVRLWDVKTGKEKAVLKGHTGKVPCVAFSGNGKLLATGYGGLVRLWDVSTGESKATFKQPLPYNFEVRCVVFSGDNETLASATKGEVYLWNVATGKLRATLHRYKMPESVAFGGSGNLLAVGSGGTGGPDGEPPKVFLWEIVSTKKAEE